ncbi:MAG TPA: PEGA domain-containing protein, partial [bacterium]|nr:PEGA domain-containing protein [bacterium]
FYLFPDSFSQKSSGNIVAETASYLAGSEYDYLKTEAALFVPSMSVAKRDLEEGLKTFEEAKALYNDLSIEEAITKFQSARKTIEKHLDKIPDMKVLGDILLYLGASYKMLDEDDEATPLFSSYLSIYPDAELDDIVFSPEIISFFDRIKEDFLMLPNGSVRVESFPEGALVSINGKIVGITPTKVHGITEGRHYYRIHKNGYRDRAGTFTVRERKESKIAEDLSKYDNAGFLHEAESFMVKEYGRLAMLRKCVEIAEKMKVDSVLVTSLTVDGETVKYSGHIVNREKRNFKKVETSFLLPDRKDLTEVDELQKFNKDLINDTYGFKPISDVALDEAELLGLDTKKDKKDKGTKTPIYKQWWLWTLLGVVVLGGAGVGTYFAVTASQGKESGASLEINFK